ncbi:MAG: hypothetical protein KTR30_14185 [Saprospiraceae bacterium]|nr:hypothetical protein [Saprospiraceae bacterium]
MLNFFRRIRQKLLANGNLNKYLAYAIGEIVLVVIGILIALQVNNWNQAHSDETKLIALLHDLAVDLTLEVDESEQVLDYYYQKDSLIALNLSGKLVEEDLQTTCKRCPRYLLLNYPKIPINTIAYDQIKSMIDRIPKKYEYLTSQIKQLYEVDVKIVLEKQVSIERRTSDFRQSLISNHPWFRQIAYNQLSAEAVGFFLNDPIYMNRLADYRNSGQNFWTYLNQFRGRAIHVLHLIAQIKPAKIEEALNNRAYFLDNKQISVFSGRYNIPEFDNFKFDIETSESRIYTNLFQEGRTELVPQSDSSLYFASRFIKFKFSNKSLSLIGSDGSTIVCEKIE